MAISVKKGQSRMLEPFAFKILPPSGQRHLDDFENDSEKNALIDDNGILLLVFMLIWRENKNKKFQMKINN